MPTTTPRPVTHADLAPKPHGPDLASKTGALLTILCILCGLLCFILSLFAEATRSEVLLSDTEIQPYKCCINLQVTWVLANNLNGQKGHNKGRDYECVYSGSGKVPLICAAVAFVALATAMLVQHSFMLIAISKTSPPTFVSWDPNASRPMKSLTWQAGFFFISTWICFAVGEIMLLIGLSVESGHLNDWSTPKPSCLIIREGVFTAAGVFSLLTVFLAAGLYATALRVQWLCQESENVRREVLEASDLYASPPRSPRHDHTTHNPPTNVTRQNQTVQPSTLSQYQSALSHKQGSLV